MNGAFATANHRMPSRTKPKRGTLVSSIDAILFYVSVKFSYPVDFAYLIFDTCTSRLPITCYSDGTWGSDAVTICQPVVVSQGPQLQTLHHHKNSLRFHLPRHILCLLQLDPKPHPFVLCSTLSASKTIKSRPASSSIIQNNNKAININIITPPISPQRYACSSL